MVLLYKSILFYLHFYSPSYLILIDLSVLKLSFSLLLERDDDQGHENINKEKRKHYKVNYVKDRHFYTEVSDWTHIFICCCH
jgi:hypothetical protein